MLKTGSRAAEGKAENEKRISDLEKALAESNRKALSSEITSAFANAGLSTETYASAIKAFSSMPADKSEDVMKEVKTFVDGISEANKAALDNAKSEWEKSVLDNTPNPGGGNPDKQKKMTTIVQQLSTQKLTQHA